MVLPYPERFRWKYVILFIVLLFLAQQIEGSDVVLSALTAIYIALFAAAFNVSGGLYYPSGAFIFFTATLTAIVGFTWKVTTGEPAQSNLLVPTSTMLVYCASMGVMFLTAGASRRLIPKRGLLVDINADKTMMQAAIGCFVFGLVFQLAFGSEYASAGTVASAFRQFNRFPQMAILLATTYELKRSNRQSATNWVVFASVGIMFTFGVIYSSKEGMFVGPVTWLLAALAGGYNFKKMNFVFGGIGLWFMLYYMVPYSQYVRNFRDIDGNRAANTATALQYIFQLGDVRQHYLAEGQDEEDYYSAPHLYNYPQGLMDRLSMFAYDDTLTWRTDQGYVYGVLPTFNAFVNIVPRFIWKDKPFFFTANAYGREIGVIGENDITTGISFSPTADAYHQAKWYGIFIIWPLVTFLYFFITDSLTGDVRVSPWGLLPVALVSHVAPEGMVDGVILQFTYGSIGIVIVAWTVRYIFPLLVRLLTGGEKTIVRKGRDFRLGARPPGIAPPPAGPVPPAS